MDRAGVPAPSDLYPGLSADLEHRLTELIHRNDELVTTVAQKNEIVALLARSLEAATQAFVHAGPADLDCDLHFFGEQTTVRRIYLRLLTHAHEHMGQMIGYMRSIGIVPPWPDWREGRRTQQAVQSD